ncbi:hypothetical protein VTO73DRAFT_8260 [Trametes versicolor]
MRIPFPPSPPPSQPSPPPLHRPPSTCCCSHSLGDILGAFRRLCGRPTYRREPGEADGSSCARSAQLDAY